MDRYCGTAPWPVRNRITQQEMSSGQVREASSVFAVSHHYLASPSQLHWLSVKVSRKVPHISALAETPPSLHHACSSPRHTPLSGLSSNSTSRKPALTALAHGVPSSESGTPAASHPCHNPPRTALALLSLRSRGHGPLAAAQPRPSPRGSRR